jgi:hypothetical protein
MKPFNLEEAKAGKAVCTRDGRDVTILTFDRKSQNYPIVGLLPFKRDGDEDMGCWTSDGSYFSGGQEDEKDLFIKSTKEKRFGVLFEDYDDGNGGELRLSPYLHSSRQDALAYISDYTHKNEYKKLYQIIEFEVEI